MMNNLYAGIGSRETPRDIYELMVRIARLLAAAGWGLRSGAADGADSAFEQGAGSSYQEIWLPWRGFNNHADTGFYPTDRHFEYAATVHPAWDRLTRGPRALHARNIGQVLGADLATPVRFVLVWTKDGCESEKERTRDTGGSATAIVTAARLGIPVFNLKKPDALERLQAFLKQVGVTLEFQAAVDPQKHVDVEPGINIWSGAEGLGGALTNMSELARQKGKIKHQYPVRVGNISYPDSEAAYQALKYPGVDAYNDGLMIDLIALKLRQNPRLQQHITLRGGVSWLGRCSHYTQAKSERFQAWEGTGSSSRFIRNLMHGYQKSLDGVGPSTRVVHVKDAPYDVYIGRQMGDEFAESIWHNPFKVGVHGSLVSCVQQYHERLLRSPDLLNRVQELQGKTLGCWCKTKEDPYRLCHGDVLAALAEGLSWSAPVEAQGVLF